MRIRWTDPAIHDFTNICDYINEHGSGSTARGVALYIHEALDLLEKFPGRGRIGRQPNTRELVLGRLPYIAIYRIHTDTIEILRILHGAQMWP
jgi:toxin ParE1/3/4